MKKCIVLVSDKNYLSKTFQTISEIRNNGNYSGDLVLLPHNNLQNDDWLLEMSKEYNVLLKFFEPIDMSIFYTKINQKPFANSVGTESKIMQWHKLHLFDIYFKQWDSVFYIDAGMRIFDDLNIFWNFVTKDKLVAHSDGYPAYSSKLKDQFNSTSYPLIYKQLNEIIDLTVDGFQSTMMLYDTSIIQDKTKNDLIGLANQYYISRNNDQAILNIYFNGLHKLWSVLPIKYQSKFTYDFWERGTYTFKDYVMLKYPKTLH